MRDYKKIKAWQLADELTVRIYQIKYIEDHETID